jgi:hypothetical protein
MSESCIKEDEAAHLGTTDDFADLFQIPAVKRDKIADELGVAGFTCRGRFLAIDPPFDVNTPFLRVLPAESMSHLHTFFFGGHRTLREPDFSRVMVATRDLPASDRAEIRASHRNQVR